jgi:hypothetical protein
MTVCANHHRQLHYGGIDVVITAKAFEFEIDGAALKIPRLLAEGEPSATAAPMEPTLEAVNE